MADRYSSFAELRAEKREGVHFRLNAIDRGSRVLVMAPHGGKIEPHTSELAQEIAGDAFSFFSFAGCQQSRNFADLHITSANYDEPTARRMASEASTVLALHGEGNRSEAYAMMGGLDDALVAEISMAIRAAGVSVRAPAQGLAGRARSNICNQGQSGRGVQIELSHGLRQSLAEDHAGRSAFVLAIRGVLDDFERGTPPNA